MKFHYLLFFTLFLSIQNVFLKHVLYAQTPYFQQEVNYNISVSLNDKTHHLSAFEKIQYINNSSTSLSYIYFHLWPNAYKNQETALAKQLLENGETTMYFAKEEDLGYIDSLDFRVNGQSVKWEYDKEHTDICKIYLNEPLKSLDTLMITTPFHVKLPSAKISRLGHIDQAYAITQWYPKPAVFDNTGWHQMPYLNQGEFYSEFGSFNVKITLPKNYVLAATGDRINAVEEEKWLEEKAAETKKMFLEPGKKQFIINEIPESSSELKTIQFKQYRVHDFAWFADKRFNVLKGSVYLPKTDREIETWAFFTNNEPYLWDKSIEYLNDATFFYSSMLGDYPYNHVTAIDGTISAGGGMEYPNITIIGESGNSRTLETTIMHEVGHNWFYGILGSNEREYPFLDEGLNSFYEMRYIQTKYPNDKLTSLLGRDSTFKFFGLNKFKHKAQYEFSYFLAARKNLDQPILIPAKDFTNFNYGAIVYSKSALVFDYLMNYLGKEKFDEAMKFYFEQWKFKHPTPEELIKTLQYYLNADLNWFVNDILMSNKKIDYKAIAYRQSLDDSHAILVKNNSNVLSPISISGFKKGKLVGTVWYNGFKGKRVLEFPSSEVDEFVIDANNFIPDISRKNNNIRTRGIFKKREKVQFNFLGKIDDPHFNQINYLPIMGYNMYNQFMLGCAFYNYSLLQKKIELTIAPMYAFGSKSLTGFIEVDKNILPSNKHIQQITVSAKAKSFTYDQFNSEYLNSLYNQNISNTYLNYYKFSGTIDFLLKKKEARSSFDQHIGYTSNVIFRDNMKFKFDTTSVEVKKEMNELVINNLYYSLKNSRVINPYSVAINFQHTDLFGKLSAELKYAITFKNKNSFDIRFFAGAFVYGDTRSKGPYRFRMSGFNGYHDYLFDYNFIGRNEFDGLSFSQFTEIDGAFKVWTPLGQSSKWLIAINLKSPKIGKLPLKLYLDIGASEYNESLLNEKVLHSFGVNLTIWKNVIDVYIPITYSKDIKKAIDANNKSFFETIRFTLNLHNIKPKQFISNNVF